MLKNLFRNKIKLFMILILTFGLIVIRACEDVLFYDPFLDYFRSNYQNNSIPKIDNFKLFSGLFFRYFANAVLSISIIYIVFKDPQMLQFSAFIYFILFLVLVFSFFVILILYSEDNKMTLFYLRRFLIQPIFLLLFLPAFYFQKMQQIK